jgi:hypothetical protein
MATLDLDALMGFTQRESKADALSKFKSNLKDIEAAEEAKIVAEPGRKRPRSTAEDKWWVLPETTLTPEVKRDLQIIQSRGFIDPKRFYKVS